MPEIIIPQRSDYTEIAQLVNGADKVFFSVYTPEEAKEVGVASETAESLTEGEKNRQYLAVKENGVFVAFTSFRLKNNQTVWISSLYAHADHQRKGYGGLLLSEIEKFAKLNGALVITLETEVEADWAVRFYKKQGYIILSKEDLKIYPFDKVIDKEPVSGRYIIGKKI